MLSRQPGPIGSSFSGPTLEPRQKPMGAWHPVFDQSLQVTSEHKSLRTAAVTSQR